MSLSISPFLYEELGFHCLWFFLGLCPEWSLSSALGYCSPLYLLFAQLCAFAPIVVASVVKVEPDNTKLLDEDPKLLAKVEAVGWLPFFSKFADSNPKITRLFSLSLVNGRAKVADLQFIVYERTVASAMDLPLAGEHWFKSK